MGAKGDAARRRLGRFNQASIKSAGAWNEDRQRAEEVWGRSKKWLLALVTWEHDLLRTIHT